MGGAGKKEQKRRRREIENKFKWHMQKNINTLNLGLFKV